ncbi:hypothetical protein M9H77_13500 [Catharanthus roseus]|uniref:Uncharacterized protein n=1 Tax=Catharanthus roseus TaxID=4058 RepID=A0ACC0BKL1_CATRO|nr:hypothetical protein M9H77_13500 [Catharanthus roseus]
MYNEHNDSYYYGGYNCKRSSPTLGTTSRPLSYNNLKFALFWGTFDLLCYEIWEQEVESLFYSYCVREDEKRMGLKPIKTWSLIKQALRIKFEVVNHERQGKGQSKVKFMESSMVEEFPKIKEFSQAKIEESHKNPYSGRDIQRGNLLYHELEEH